MKFHRTYRYKFDKIRIKSEIVLTKEQLERIVEIVNDLNLTVFYEPCYQISREIYYLIQEFNNNLIVKTKYTKRGNFKIELLSS